MIPQALLQDRRNMTISLDYLAGFFDGEGSVYIAHRHVKLDVAMTVANTNPEPLELIQEAYGGGLSIRNRANEKHKAVWVWTLRGDRAVALLEAILDKLII